MHRDIKPENLLISDGGDSCLLTDFGFALDYKKSKCVTRLGTTDYMAPEIVRCDKARRDELRALGKNGYGPEVDCWAIGVLAYECLVGTAPFEGGTTTEETYARILEGNVPEMPPGIS
jgi:serine/threonine protein kinase